MVDYGTCWRCGRDIRCPGNNYQCSSGAWVMNGTVAQAVAQVNYVIGSKIIAENYKKSAHKDAIAHGFSLSTEKDIEKRRYSGKAGTEETLLKNVKYSKAEKERLKALCDAKEKSRTAKVQ